MADDEEALREYCSNWEQYPKGLIRNPDRPGVVEVIRDYFNHYFSTMCINRDPYVIIRDYGSDGSNAGKTHAYLKALN
jgi:hypothetical protein